MSWVMTQSEARQLLEQTQQEFEETFGERLRGVVAKATGAFPSIVTVIQALDGIYDRQQTSFSIDDYYGWTSHGLVGTIAAVDVSPTPTSVDSCVSPPYAQEETQSGWSLIAEATGEVTDKTAGQFFVSAYGSALAAASGYSIIGEDLKIPAGFNQFVVTADIVFHSNTLSVAFLGVAGAGIDLYLKIDKGDGTPPVEVKQPNLATLSPLVWWNSAESVGNRLIATSFTTDTASARTLRVLAGASAHAEVVALIGASGAFCSGHVKRICVHAY